MHLPQYLLIFLYATIVVSLVWARLRFFKVTSRIKKYYVYLYDPAAILQITATFYLFFTTNSFINGVDIIAASIGYILSFSIFWWSIMTAKGLDFAFSAKIETLLKEGPYSIVRHPFYLSYTIAWMTSSFMFNNLILWITLGYMMAYYYLAAKSEEEAILASEYSNEYRLYSQSTGMFLPRMKKWKSYK